MSRPADSLARSQTRFPRVSGDEPNDDKDLPSHIMFSPRERG